MWYAVNMSGFLTIVAILQIAVRRVLVLSLEERVRQALTSTNADGMAMVRGDAEEISRRIAWWITWGCLFPLVMSVAIACTHTSLVGAIEIMAPPAVVFAMLFVSGRIRNMVPLHRMLFTPEALGGSTDKDRDWERD